MGTPYDQISPQFEATLVNSTVTMTLPDGQQKTLLRRGDKNRNWVGSYDVDPGETGITIPGADGKPRAHGDITSKPKFVLRTPFNMAVAIVDFARTVNGTCDILIDTLAPTAKISTYILIKTWLPLYPKLAVKPGEPAMAEITGDPLSVDLNYKGQIDMS